MFTDKKRRIYILLALSIFILVLIFIVCLFKKNKLVIENYENEVTIEVGRLEDLKDPKICYGTIFNCVDLKLKKDSNVNLDKLGTYEETYTYTYSKHTKKLKRKVVVVDTEKPKITLDGVTNICPNGTIISKNVIANDNYDGDLTDKIELKKEDENYYYYVEDSSGNSVKEKAEVKIEDTVSPELFLKNGNIGLNVGDKYTEYGATASDNCDGDITSSIKISGTVNTNQAGKYTISYEVVDSASNKTTLTRTVTVKEVTHVVPNIVEPDGNKVVYLTFDDGPGPYTLRLLDILRAYNVKATFFVTNQFGSGTYLSYLRNIRDDGHSIGIHSYSHKYSIYSSVDDYFYDLEKMKEVIKNYTGIETNLVRFPGGSSNTISKNYKVGIMTELSQELENRGYKYFDWNLMSGDAGQTSSSTKIFSNVTNGIKNGTYVVLLHDIHSYTVNSIESILVYGLEHGYTFKALDENSPTMHHRINN